MITPTQAVILAGGLGTRLGNKTQVLPKPMMDIAGRPFLDYLVHNLRRQGIEKVILSIGYLSEEIVKFLGSGEAHGIEIQYAREDSPQGTGGALRNCIHLLEERFFVLNGDTLFDVNFAGLSNTSQDNVIALRPVDDASRYGSVTLKGNWVSGFAEKGSCGPAVINGGVLCLNRRDLRSLPAGKCSLEHTLLPALANQRLLSGYISNSFFIDIGVPSSLDDAQSLIPQWEAKPIAFLDRDGVLNHDCGHAHRLDQFEWIDGAREAVGLLNSCGYHVVLVTNQAGVAKGLYSEEDFHLLTRWMRTELWKAGAHLDAVYYCPFHPEAVLPRYRRESEDRKPNPGMLFRAMAEIPHYSPNSFFIGDRSTDRQAAEAAGISYFNFTGGNLLDFVRSTVDQY